MIAFEEHSFVNYNILKVKSKYRTQTGRRLHIGGAFINDKFRYQLFINHPDNGVPDLFSFTKSKIISFDIDPYTNTIKNLDSIKEFLDFINIFNNIPDTELYEHFLSFDKLFKGHYFREKTEPITLKKIQEKLNEKLYGAKPVEETLIARKSNEEELKLLETISHNQKLNI